MLSSHDALLVIDPQVDFFPGGALAVPEGDAILPAINRAIEVFVERGLPVVVTRDWHPPDHCSFIEQGGPWPPHCVRGTGGAELHAELALPPLFTMVHKATTPDREAYSDFEGTGLSDLLRTWVVRRIYVGGLALDYCVRASCLGAIDAGFEVVLLTNATRAVNVEPEDGDRALAELVGVGVRPLDGSPE
jgi:nicotinamidase/pyrazinamidase